MTKYNDNNKTDVEMFWRNLFCFFNTILRFPTVRFTHQERLEEDQLTCFLKK